MRHTICINSPWEGIAESFKKLPYNLKIAFSVSSLSAFLTHIFYFTGRFANEDDHHWIKYTGWHVSLGRWANGFRFSEYVLPVVSWVIFTLCIAITVCLILWLFRIQRVGPSVAVSIALPAFPILAVHFGYAFQTVTISISILTAAISVFLTRKYRHGWTVGALFLAVSLGEYQAFIAVAMTMCLVSLIVELFQQEKLLDWVALAIRYLLMGVLGLCLYRGILSVMLKATGQTLASYKGLDTMGQVPLSKIPELLKRTYVDFAGFFRGKQFITADGLLRCCYLCLFLVCGYSILRLIWKLKKKPALILVLLILVGLFPFCANVVDFVAVKTSVSILNIFAFCLLLPTAFALSEQAEKLPFSSLKGNAAINWGLLVASIVIGWNWFVDTNIYYSKISEYYTYTVQLSNRVLARIEALPEYSEKMPVAFVLYDGYGNTDEPDYRDVFLSDQGFLGPFIGYGRQKTVRTPADIMNNALGSNITYATEKEIAAIRQNSEYHKMTSWPKEGCIKVIDGYIVVNFVPAEKQFYPLIEYVDGHLEFKAAAHPDFPIKDYRYAWYVFCDSERVDTGEYQKQPNYSYVPQKAGQYYGRLYIKSVANGERFAINTGTITVSLDERQKK